MRVGVIGTGFGRRVVAAAFSGVGGCEVVDVVSPRQPAAVAELCRRRDVDLVSVHSPPALHLQHVRLAVEAGHHVLCDKPFGLCAEEAAAMRDMAAAAGVVHLANFENRWDAARRSVHDAVTEGAVGAPEHLAYSWLVPYWRVPARPHGWLFDAAAGGGWLRAMGSHLIDFVAWTLGEVTAVSGHVRTVVAQRLDPSGGLRPCTADDGFTLALRTATDAGAVIDTTAAASVARPASLVVLGADGAVTETAAGVVLHRSDGDRRLLGPSAPGDPLLAAMAAYAPVVRDAVHDRQAPAGAPTLDDAVACSLVMDRVAANRRLGFDDRLGNVPRWIST